MSRFPAPRRCCAPPSNIRFPGQYFDAETGLHYNRFRYCDPAIGRYVSADPIGQAGGVNVFGYVGNNPVGMIDPLGLDGPSFSDLMSMDPACDSARVEIHHNRQIQPTFRSADVGDVGDPFGVGLVSGEISSRPGERRAPLLNRSSVIGPGNSVACIALYVGSWAFGSCIHRHAALSVAECDRNRRIEVGAFGRSFGLQSLRRIRSRRSERVSLWNSARGGQALAAERTATDDSPKRRSRFGLASGVAMGFAVIVGVTIPDYGVTWDEALYLEESVRYTTWLSSPALDTIDASWKSTHPPLHRILGGLSRALFADSLGWLEALTAFRLATAGFAFLLAGVFFRFAEDRFGRACAFAGTIALLSMPRFFYHAHIGALDVPVAALVLCCCVAYWRSFERPSLVWVAAALLGLGLSLKLNAAIAVVPMLVLLMVRIHEAVAANEPVPPIIARQGAIVLIPPLLFIAVWPWLWLDPIGRSAQLFGYHAEHFPIATTYFGRVFSEAPFHYPVVMTALTVPLATLALTVGALAALRRPAARGTLVFLWAGAIAPLVFFALPGVPKSGGVRHFLVGYPFLCLLAAAGLRELLDSVQHASSRRALYALVVAVVSIGGVWSNVRLHPHQIAYFNPLIGGTRGAAERGFDLDYWGGSYRGLLAWMNAHPDRIYWMPLAPRIGRFDQVVGALDSTIRFGSAEDSDTLVLLHRPSFYNHEMLQCLRSDTPLARSGPPGTDLARLCDRRR